MGNGDGDRTRGIEPREFDPQHPAHAAVRHDNGGFVDLAEPGAYPPREALVALPARRRDAPFVGLAGSQRRRRDLPYLGGVSPSQ